MTSNEPCQDAHDPPEETLDPDDWDAFRKLAHRMVDDMVDHLNAVRERPVWQPLSPAARAAFEEPLPVEGAGEEAAYRGFLTHVLPFPTGNLHPRFWGWVKGAGTPLGMMAEMLAAAINPNTGGFEQAATHVERQVIRWLQQLLGFPKVPGTSQDTSAKVPDTCASRNMPDTTTGLLTSGASMANVIALAVARHAGAGFDVRRHGLADAPRLALYASRETHSSVTKAVELLGLGSDALRLAKTRKNGSVDVSALARAVDDDRRRGWRPFCLVGNAGTVNTGAVDDLTALADLAAEEGLWLHVDGAFGAWAAASPRLRPLVAGIERADSLAFDLHKWGSQPYEAGCVLVARGKEHLAAFTQPAAYLAALPGGLAAPGSPNFANLGPELSRGFRALKVWMAFKAHGAAKLVRLVEQNVEQARHLAGLVEAHPRLALAAPVALNVVCFRYQRPGLGQAATNRLNRRLLVALQESGAAVVSSTQLHGRFCLRAALVNHRTRRADLERLVSEVVRWGDSLTARA